MRIYITSIFVDDQTHALDFYTNKLGFQVKNDIPMDGHRWLTEYRKNKRPFLLNGKVFQAFFIV